MKYENKKGYIQPPINPHNEPFVDELNSLLESLHTHDDRSVVLNMAAFAEDTLEILLLAYLREEMQAKELVTGFNAPLGTFSARIKAAFVLGLLRQDGYETLEILRKIRNKFAHNWSGVSLDRDDIKSHINRLSRSRFEEFTDAQSEECHQAPDRERLIYKISDILIDIRLLAKALKTAGRRAPFVAIDGKPIRAEFLEVDKFTDEKF